MADGGIGEKVVTHKSVYFSQHEVLDAIEALHIPTGFEADVTYGNGMFYKGRREPALKFDIQPQLAGVTQADSCALPLAESSLGSVMFDPPFLTYVKGGRDHKAGAVQMTARFGGYWTYGELTAHYTGTIAESARVLRKGGMLVVKCQDIIHNHRMHCTHANVIVWATERGFRLKDLFVLAAKHRMPGPQKGRQRHARIYHSYFLVFERT
jgi:hypothetical protein